MPNATRHIAVLTGDLVKSTQLGRDDQARAMERLASVAEDLATWHGAPLHFTASRGDGWQVALGRPERALRTALAFRAAVKGLGKRFDTAISIAEGPIDRDLAANLNLETAEVFVNSGRALDAAKSQAVPFHHADTGARDAVAALLGAISDDWTPAQAEAAYLALHPDQSPNYTDIGAALGKSRQAVTKALGSAKCEPIRRALQLLETTP